MCGIVGLLPNEPTDPATLETLIRKMNNALTHRGPDDEGYFIDRNIALGMRRLAIIDVASGQQPMKAARERFALVFNGEIYNFREIRKQLETKGYQFKTRCDTEVVLHSFEDKGLEGIKPLEGMFAFAVWDAQLQSLTLARDWMGQKSIFLARTKFGLAFASEIKALLVLPDLNPELDLAPLSHYMSLRFLPGRSTLFSGIEKLPPATAMTICHGKETITNLWKPTYQPKIKTSETEYLDELDSTMRLVVEQHLMSEVPIGSFLSGGIDSSLAVAYAASSSSTPLRTFCVGVHEASQNEIPFAREVAQMYGTDHHEEVIEPDLAMLAPRMTASLEEPVDPFGAGVYIASSVAAQHVTVTLGGDGGDELFSGYDRYLGQQYAEHYSHLPQLIRHGILRPLIHRFPDNFQYNNFAARLRWIDRMADFSGPRRYAESATFLRFNHALKSELFTESSWRQIDDVVSEKQLETFFTDGCAEGFLDKMLHADCMTRLADNDLPTTDRLTMAHSLELRSPFLDRRIAELAMQAPIDWKMKKRNLKYLTRRLAERYLPKTLIYRPKKGFGFPIALWLRGPLRKLMVQTIDESRLVAAGVLRSDTWEKLLKEHVNGGIDHNYRLWLLFNLEVFYRHYFEGTEVSELEAWIADIGN